MSFTLPLLRVIDTRPEDYKYQSEIRAEISACIYRNIKTAPPYISLARKFLSVAYRISFYFEFSSFVQFGIASNLPGVECAMARIRRPLSRAGGFT